MTISTRAKNTITYLCLAIVVGCGAYIRLYRALDDTWWIDGARDAYVAKTMWETKTFPMIAPIAGAGNGMLTNSPLYYFLLASIWGITKSAAGIVNFYTGLNILMIPIAFFIGRELTKSKLVGLQLATFISFNQVMVLYSRNIFQPYLIPPIVSAIILCWILANTYNSVVWRICYVGLIFLGVNIHYSLLMLVPSLFIWLVIMTGRNIKIETSFIKILYQLVPITLFLVLSAIWIFLARNANPNFDLVKFSETQFQVQGDYHYTPYSYLGVLFPILNSRLQVVIFCGITLGLGVLALEIIKKRRVITNYSLFLLSLFLCSFFLIFLKTAAAYNEFYYAPFFVISLISIAVILYRWLHKLLWLHLIMTLLVVWILNPNMKSYFHRFVTFDYTNTREMSQTLYSYHSQNYLNQAIYLYTYTHNSTVDITVPAYLFFLEDMTGSHLARLVSDDYKDEHNVEQYTHDQQKTYLLCDHYSTGLTPNEVVKDCFEKFSSTMNVLIESSTLVSHISRGAYNGVVCEVTLKFLNQ